MSYVFWRVPSSIKLRPEKKVQLSGHQLECLGVPSARIVLAGSLIKLWPEKKVQSSGHRLQCQIVLAGSLLCFLVGSSIKLQITTGKKVQLVVWLAYTICNTRNIIFLLCLYLKQGNKLIIGIVWFEGKAPSRTSKTCLTMVEPFAGPSSMAMGNQPMPLRYPLCKRLSEGGVRGFLLTLWSGGEIIFLSKYIDFILIWYTTQLNCPQTINLRFPRAPLTGRNSPPSPPPSRRRAFGWLLCDFHSSAAV